MGNRMKAPKEILTIWNQFDRFPMETLTKAWYFNKAKGNKQREVSLMREHRDQFGITGNCFDLAIWLLDECKKAKISAYPIAHDIQSEGAHVAVIMLDDHGNRYLCDLGDQWIQPILINSSHEDFTRDKLNGFFPGAKVQVIPLGDEIEVLYHRPNGKISKQIYQTNPIQMRQFLEAAEFSQNLLKSRPLLEMRIPLEEEVAHWEFYNWKSFLSTSEGLFHDSKLDSIEEWARRIHEKTGYQMNFLIEALSLYKKSV